MAFRRTQIQFAGLTLLTAVVAAGCGGSSGDSRAVPASTVPVTAASVAHSTPSSSTTKPRSTPTTHKVVTTSTTSTTSVAVVAPTTLPAADLAALQQDLDAAGSSLGGADAALSQTDPNQTATFEGTTP